MAVHACFTAGSRVQLLSILARPLPAIRCTRKDPPPPLLLPMTQASMTIVSTRLFAGDISFDANLTVDCRLPLEQQVNVSCGVRCVATSSMSRGESSSSSSSNNGTRSPAQHEVTNLPLMHLLCHSFVPMRPKATSRDQDSSRPTAGELLWRRQLRTSPRYSPGRGGGEGGFGPSLASPMSRPCLAHCSSPCCLFAIPAKGCRSSFACKMLPGLHMKSVLDLLRCSQDS